MLELQSLIAPVLKAGDRVYSIYNSDFSVKWKDAYQDDPLTQADLEANSILTEFLKREFPEDSIVSEEADKYWNHSARQWIIDPIDGTREFVSKNPEFAISLGSVWNNQPESGIIFNPIKGELFVGLVGVGVFETRLEYPYSNLSVKLELKKFDYPSANKKPKCTVSRSEFKENIFQIDVPLTKDFSIHPVGSIAYKLALAAFSRYDMVISVYEKNDWDICAGVNILLAAGGSVLELKSMSPVQFNQNDLTCGLIAGNPNIIEYYVKNNEASYSSLYRKRVKKS